MKVLKYTILILLLLAPNLSFTQENSEENDTNIDEYNQLFNYETKSISNDRLTLSLSEKFKIQLNTIGNLYVYYGIMRQHHEFTSEQISLMEKRINQIALGLFLEGNPVIIESVGGYSGCPDKLIYSDKYLNTDITKLLFCFTCTDIRKYHHELLNIFNKKTKELIEKNNS